jgi:membrane-bound metal-dependent hydrolase YbcI (DUF457 family)
LLPLGHIALALAASDFIDGDHRAAVLASQLPDLVDKPAAWVFKATESSRYVAHTLLAASLCLTIVAVAAPSGIFRGVFAGYLTHLAGDQIFGGKLPLLWPLKRYQLGHKAFRLRPRTAVLEIVAGAYLCRRWWVSRI